jgi:hypothetical protein
MEEGSIPRQAWGLAERPPPVWTTETTGIGNTAANET